MNLPRDWTKKPEGPESDSGWLRDAWMFVRPVVALLLILGGAGGFLFLLLKYSGKL